MCFIMQTADFAFMCVNLCLSPCVVCVTREGVGRCLIVRPRLT